jgi:hypothetical protein
VNSKLFDLVTGRIDEIISQSPFPEDVFHSINTLEWVLRLAPDADSALQIAALGHDIERGFPDRCIHASNFKTYDEYKQAHALNCAQILSEVLEDCGVEQAFIDDVARLTANHETGGDPRQEALKNADILSFFHVSLPLFNDRRGPEITKRRCVWGFKKLPPELQYIVREMDYPDETLKQLIDESIGL